MYSMNRSERSFHVPDTSNVPQSQLAGCHCGPTLHEALVEGLKLRQLGAAPKPQLRWAEVPNPASCVENIEFDSNPGFHCAYGSASGEKSDAETS